MIDHLNFGITGPDFDRTVLEYKYMLTGKCSMLSPLPVSAPWRCSSPRGSTSVRSKGSKDPFDEWSGRTVCHVYLEAEPAALLW